MTPVTPRALMLPPYAKALRENRRRGFHPLRVDVVYGDDWSVPRACAKKESAQFVREGRAARPYTPAWVAGVGVPTLALRPRDYAPGIYDFRCVAGVVVTVLDLAGGFDDFEIDETGRHYVRWGLFFDLLGELGQYAGDLRVRRGCHGDDVDVSLFAFEARLASNSNPLAYPRWWSEDKNRRIEAGSIRCLMDAAYVENPGLRLEMDALRASHG